MLGMCNEFPVILKWNIPCIYNEKLGLIDIFGINSQWDSECPK